MYFHPLTQCLIILKFIQLCEICYAKQLLAEHGKSYLEKEIIELEAKKKNQMNKIIEIKKRIGALKARNIERRAIHVARRVEEMNFLEF